MLRIAICDDENKICELYQEKLRYILIKNHIAADLFCYCDAKQFLAILKKEAYDILLLDIDMPGITGLQIAEEMNKSDLKPLLIFVTNQDALVYHSFQYHPFGFIRKSYFEDEIETVLLNAVGELMKEDQSFVFRYESETIRLAVSQILYFEASGNYLMIHTKENIYRCRDTMAKVENLLSLKGFIRIHKGFLLNQESVFRIGAENVTLTDGSVLPVGRSNKEEVRQKLMRYLMR